jgi:thioredoxin-related protein
MKRLLMTISAVIALALPVSAEVGDDGLHKEPWMRDTFKDLREDLDEANAEGKRFAVIIEQRGCIYCRKMHEEVYIDPELSQFIDDNFFMVQMNLHGSDTATDFDGQEMAQSDLMRKWGILFTPTVIFFPEEVPEGVPAPQASVAIMPGAFAKGTTTDMYTWVAEKRYLLDNGEDFQRYHARRIQERNNGKFD